MLVESRLTSAKQLVSNIDLRFLPTQYLLGRVNDSGLVTPEHILDVQNMQFKSAFAFVRGAGTDIVNGLSEWVGHICLEEGASWEASAEDSISYKKIGETESVPMTLFLHSDRKSTFVALGSGSVTDGMQTTYYATTIPRNFLNTNSALCGENVVYQKGTEGEGKSPFPTIDFSPPQNRAAREVRLG